MAHKQRWSHSIRGRNGRIWMHLVFLVATMLLYVTSACCRPKQDVDPAKPAELPGQPVASQPAEPASASQPAVNPIQTLRVTYDDPHPDPNDWLAIESLREEASAGWATGSITRLENKIEIQTEGVGRISLDLSKMHMDWNRRVVLRIDGRPCELLHGDSSKKYLQITPAGRWIAVEGKK